MSVPNLGTYNLYESVSVSSTLAYYSFVLYTICKYPNGWLCTPKHKYVYQITPPPGIFSYNEAEMCNMEGISDQFAFSIISSSASFATRDAFSGVG